MVVWNPYVGVSQVLLLSNAPSCSSLGMFPFALAL